MDENLNQPGAAMPTRSMQNKKIFWLTVIVAIIAIISTGIYFLAPAKKYNAANISNSQAATTMEPTNKSYDVNGVRVEIVKEGNGAPAKTGDTVTVNYTGTLQDGTVFDSSLKPGRTPFQFTLGQNLVIQGWEMGVVGMKVGEKRKLTIPPELGYGAGGAGGIIPPNATLIFEIEMVKIS